MPTLRDVAELAGVSVATVSHVINNTRRTAPETRARVQRAIKEVGFTPNPAGRMLALQRSRGARSPVAAGRRDADAERPGAPPGSATACTLLRILRAAQPISRAELARRLRVQRSTVTDLVKPLLASGVLAEGPAPAEAAATGRPPVGLRLREQGRAFAGVHIGVEATRVRVATLCGRVLGEASFETPPRARDALKAIAGALGRLAASSPQHRVRLVGVSVPGPTCVERRTLLYAPHLGWENVRVAEALSAAKLDAPVVVENDATAAAAFEACRMGRWPGGAGDDFAFVLVDVGIGVGVVLGGEVYRGSAVAGGLAGEFGHMTIVANGKPCVCGGRGCWESYAGLAAASDIYAGARCATRGAHFDEVVARAAAGERRARASLAKVGEYLGIGIGNVVSALGVPRVVVGGPVLRAWEFIADPLRDTLRRTMAGRLSHAAVEAGGDEGGIGGAVEIAFGEYLKRLALAQRAH